MVSTGASSQMNQASSVRRQPLIFHIHCTCNRNKCDKKYHSSLKTCLYKFIDYSGKPT